MSTAIKAGIYIRVSTPLQVEEKTLRVSTWQQSDKKSLEFQEERLRQYCESQGYELYKVYREEGVSAKDTNRPKLNELLADIKAKRVQAVLVTKLDRITRSLKDLIWLMEFFQEQEIRLISLTQNIDTSGPMGRFMLSLLGAVAQMERELTAERVSEHMHHRALAGKWNGGVVTYGFVTRYRIFRELRESGVDEVEALRQATKLCPEPKKGYIDEAEAKVVRKIYDLYLQHKSIRRVADILNREGFKTRKGQTWPTTTIVRILTSPTYIGKISFGKRKSDIVTGKLKKVSPDKWKIVPGQHTGIVSEEKFNQVQALLQQRASKPTRTEQFHLLRGLLRCGRCGGLLYGYTHRKNTPHGIVAYSYYRCQTTSQYGRSMCEGMSIRADEVEKNVEHAVLNLAEDQRFLSDRELMLKEFLDRSNGHSSVEPERERLLIQEKQFEGRKATLLEKLESGLISDEDFKARYDLIRKQLDEIQDQLAELATTASDAEMKKAAMQASYESLRNLREVWPCLTTEGKNQKLRCILGRIEVKALSPREVELRFFAFLDALSSERARAMSVCKVYRRDTGSSPRRA